MEFRIDLEVFVWMTNMPPAQTNIQLYNCADKAVQTSIINTYPKLWSGDKACAVQLYHLMRSALHLDDVFSYFWAAAIRLGCGSYKCGCDGIKSQRHLWSRSCARDKPMPWIGVFLYCRIACHCQRNPGVLCSSLWVFLHSWQLTLLVC